VSDILLQTDGVTAVLAAAERARAATLVDDLALGLLGLHRPEVGKRLRDMLAPNHFLRGTPPDSPEWTEGFRAAFTGHVDPDLISPAGRSLDTFPLALNTAVLVGNDGLRLLAWVHAECEAHGYIEPAQRGWAAALVDEGLGSGLLHAAAGWPAVADLLRGPDGGVVVLSVDGESPFPDPAGDPAGDAPWKALATDGSAGSSVDWSTAIDRLRADPAVAAFDERTIRQPYGHGLTVLDLIAPDWQSRTGRVPARD
jgi:hypothetical protein